MSDDAKIWSVSEITRVVKDLLEGSVQPLWLAGELGNLTVHRSGHVYFTLKDAKTQIGGVYFGGAGNVRALGLEAGTQVEIFGRLTVYEPRGVYQINVQQIRPKGIGALQAQFEALKEKLRAEGLFEEARKRPIPTLPRCVGLVTSTDGAALRDFLQIIDRRFAGMHIRICPASVQGKGAAAEVAEGIRQLNQRQACDVIVVTRGGGSLEDLWAFNEEEVARAVVASDIPVISAVGHEVDFSICDFVADMRAPTPSAAAELVVARRADFTAQLVQLHDRMQAAARMKFSLLKARVERLLSHYVLQQPMNLVRLHQQRIDELNARLGRVLGQRLEQAGARLQRLESQLRALDPRQVLARGYAILIAGKDGAAVTDSAGVEAGDRLRGILARGELDLEVR